jgi:hypothetical protein
MISETPMQGLRAPLIRKDLSSIVFIVLVIAYNTCHNNSILPQPFIPVAQAFVSNSIPSVPRYDAMLGLKPRNGISTTCTTSTTTSARKSCLSLLLHKQQQEESFQDSVVLDKLTTQQPNIDPESILKQMANSNSDSAGKANNNTDKSTRRIFFSSILLTTAATLSPPNVNAESITWSQSPINKRSGISLTQAEQIYNIRFITYLSRFLLSFDDECQKWWYKRAGDIPRTATLEQVQSLRNKQFAMFAASVEVGLQEFEGDGSLKGRSDGPRDLMKSLLTRYGPGWEDLQKERIEKGLQPLKSGVGSDEDKYRRENMEAKRQIALLFALLKTYQPVDSITHLLATFDNGKVEKVEIVNPGSGYTYATGAEAPRVTFPQPDAGEGYEVAKGRAVLRPNGKVLRIDVDANLNEGGMGYSVGKPPAVTISPPTAATGLSSLKAATAKAFVVRDGVNKGKIERIELTNPGIGYTEEDVIKVTVATPPIDPMKLSGNSTLPGQFFVAKAVLEYEVGAIEITSSGSGYATEKPLEVIVDPPSASEASDSTSIGSKNPVIAMAYPVADSDSYKSFRKANDNKVQAFENTLLKQKLSAAGDETFGKTEAFWRGGNTSSAQLLSLLPAGIGLVYNRERSLYEIVTGDDVLNYDWAESMSPRKPIDPDFGPRGRSPIEREKKLDNGTLLRFYLAGALCSSSVHLVLTPIDVVKTNMQTKPEKYTDPLKAFKIVLEEKGFTGFFAGWVPTFLGFFINGGIAYTAIEFFRRYYTELLGDSAPNYEIPIILASSVS